MDFTEEAVAHGLRQAATNACRRSAPCRRCICERSSASDWYGVREADGLGVGEGGIERPAGGCTGEDADLELAAERVFLFGAFGERAGMALGAPAGVKPLKPMVRRLDEAAASSGSESDRAGT